jgi:aspartyl-tRNA(Asn)/glutamyl-tRNA(Gln) amidotransferase subunit A
VAAGLVPFALGSDSGGSISTPSAYCGLTGLRPSLGVVPDAGSLHGTPTLERSGPLARSAEDCRHVLDVIADVDLLEPAEALDGETLRGLRVAFHESDIEEAAEPGLRAALRDGVQAMRDLGLAFVDRTLPAELEIRRALRSIAIAEITYHYEPFQRSGALDFEAEPDERAGWHAFRALPAIEYLWALDERHRAMAAFDALFEDVDLIVSFTSPTTAPGLDRPFEPVPATGGNTALLYGSILAALPSLTVPVGLATDGLPVGLQLVVARNRDPFLLRVGEALQGTTSWHRLRPPAPPEA